MANPYLKGSREIIAHVEFRRRRLLKNNGGGGGGRLFLFSFSAYFSIFCIFILTFLNNCDVGVGESVEIFTSYSNMNSNLKTNLTNRNGSEVHNRRGHLRNFKAVPLTLRNRRPELRRVYTFSPPFNNIKQDKIAQNRIDHFSNLKWGNVPFLTSKFYDNSNINNNNRSDTSSSTSSSTLPYSTSTSVPTFNYNGNFAKISSSSSSNSNFRPSLKVSELSSPLNLMPIQPMNMKPMTNINIKPSIQVQYTTTLHPLTVLNTRIGKRKTEEDLDNGNVMNINVNSNLIVGNVESASAGGGGGNKDPRGRANIEDVDLISGKSRSENENENEGSWHGVMGPPPAQSRNNETDSLSSSTDKIVSKKGISSRREKADDNSAYDKNKGKQFMVNFVGDENYDDNIADESGQIVTAVSDMGPLFYPAPSRYGKDYHKNPSSPVSYSYSYSNSPLNLNSSLSDSYPGYSTLNFQMEDQYPISYKPIYGDFKGHPHSYSSSHGHALDPDEGQVDESATNYYAEHNTFNGAVDYGAQSHYYPKDAHKRPVGYYQKPLGDPIGEYSNHFYRMKNIFKYKYVTWALFIVGTSLTALTFLMVMYMRHPPTEVVQARKFVNGFLEDPKILKFLENLSNDIFPSSSSSKNNKKKTKKLNK